MNTSSPLILAFVADLMFGSKIQATANRLNFRFESVGNLAELADLSLGHQKNDPGEPIHGRDASIFSRLVDRQPGLIIFDLQNDQISWRKWMALLKSSPATRRIPIVAYAPHVDRDVRREAKSHGADLVATRGKFSEDLSTIIQKLIRIPDHEGLIDACTEPLSESALRGLELFNKGQFFDCHEMLEDAWNEDQSPAKTLYKGILQVAVAYLQIERGNYNGAVKMMLRVRQWLDPLPEICRGIDIGRLRREAYAIYDELLRSGPDGLAEFDRSLLKPVHYRGPEPGS